VIDDRFPFSERKNNWAFSRTGKSDEIWVLILEKVWAKLFGSYQRIEGGTAGEALYPLTGCPTKFNLHSDVTDKDVFWKRMLRSDKAKLPMCTAVAA